MWVCLANGYYLFLITYFPLESLIRCHLPSPLYWNCALRNQQKPPLGQMERTRALFCCSTWARQPCYPFSFKPAQSLASLIPRDHSFPGEASILPGASFKAWHPSLDFIFSVLFLAYAPIFSCQHYLCHSQVHVSHPTSLSSQPASPSASEQFHLLICFTLAPETQQTTCPSHPPSEFTLPEFSPSSTIISSLNQ